MGQRVRGAAIAALTMCCALTACGAEKQTQTAGATRSPAAATTTARAAVPAADGARTGAATHPSTAPALPAVAKPRSAAARGARTVCHGATAEEIGARFAERAAARASKREQRFLRVIADPPRALRANPAFALVAARVYAMSLPESDRADGFAACARELSKKESSR